MMAAEHPLFSPQVIRASAGAGKTFQLTNRLIALLAAGERPDRILATTFTRKAAGEILDRLFLRLAAAGQDPKKAQELAQAIDHPGFSSTESLLLLEKLIQNQHRLTVCTLDSFFIRIARSFSPELGLPLHWQIIEEVDDARLRTQAIAQIIDRTHAQELITLIQLLEKGAFGRSIHEQLAREVAVLHDLYRETSQSAWNWLVPPPALSSEEVEAALDALSCAEIPTNKDGTPNKNWQKAVAESIELLRANEWEQFVSKGIACAVLAGKDSFSRHKISDSHQKIFKRLIEQATAKILTRLKAQTLSTLKLLELYEREYQANKHSSGGLRFSDITHALTGAPVMEELNDLYYRLDTTISHLLFDEFQDTSSKEWRVLEPLASEILSKSGIDCSFFCVGDVKQAIYGWRGGVSEIFDRLVESYPIISEKRMEQSYRSAQPVIDLTNRIFGTLSQNTALMGTEDQEPSPSAEATSLWIEDFEQHTTARGNLPGYVSLTTPPPSSPGENDEDRVLHHAVQCVKQVADSLPGASVGVLVRTNKTVARLIYELKKGETGIDASEEGGNPLTDSPAVALMLSLLTLCDHPGDTVARYHVANSPLGEICGITSHKDNAQAAAVGLHIRDKLVQDGYGSTIYQWTKALAALLSPRDANRLMQLVELGYAYQGSATIRPSDFVSYVRSKKIEDPASAQVRVMTIHQAKGLEFDVVVIPELDIPLAGGRSPRLLTYRSDRLCPPEKIVRYPAASVRALDADLSEMYRQHEVAQIREALSILYVAITRGIHAVHMIIRPPDREKKSPPLTYASILLAALECSKDTGKEHVLYQAGDAQWFRHISDKQTVSSREDFGQEIKPQLAQVQSRRRGLLRRTPSDLEGLAEQDPVIRMRLHSQEALLRGTVIHCFFEQITWLDDGVPDRNILTQAARERVPLTSVTEEILDEFCEMLERKETNELLCRAAYTACDVDSLEVFRELPFAIRDGEAILTGTIDRVVIGRRMGTAVMADVIDYKTDRLAPEPGQTIEDKAYYYQPQIEAYRTVAARMAKLDLAKVTARLLFVNNGKMKILTPAPQ